MKRKGYDANRKRFMETKKAKRQNIFFYLLKIILRTLGYLQYQYYEQRRWSQFNKKRGKLGTNEKEGQREMKPTK